MSGTTFDTPKVEVALAARQPLELDPGELVPVFHRFIQQSRLDDLLIDVADYRHVPGGPGVLLIGHDAFYSFDGAALLVSRRRETRDAPRSLEERVRAVLRRAVTLAHALESEGELAHRLRFDYGRIELRWNDRLRAPNQESTREALRRALSPLVQRLFGDGAAVAALPDGGSPLGVAIAAAPVPAPVELLARLAA